MPLDEVTSVIFILFLVAVVVVAYRAATPEQRAHFGQHILSSVLRVKDAAVRQRPELVMSIEQRAAIQEAKRAARREVKRNRTEAPAGDRREE